MQFSALGYLWLRTATSDEPQSPRQSHPRAEKVQDHNCDLEWCRGSPQETITPPEPCAAANVLCDLQVAVPAWWRPHGAKQVAKCEQDTQISHLCWQQLREGETTLRRASLSCPSAQSHCRLLPGADSDTALLSPHLWGNCHTRAGDGNHNLLPHSFPSPRQLQSPGSREPAQESPFQLCQWLPAWHSPGATPGSLLKLHPSP